MVRVCLVQSAAPLFPVRKCTNIYGDRNETALNSCWQWLYGRLQSNNRTVKHTVLLQSLFSVVNEGVVADSVVCSETMVSGMDQWSTQLGALETLVVTSSLVVTTTRGAKDTGPDQLLSDLPCGPCGLWRAFSIFSPFHSFWQYC